MNLTLWRLALVTFTPAPRQANSFDASFEGADVRTLRSQTKDDALTTLMAAGIRLAHRPKLAAGRLVVVRDDARRGAEEALERVVNAIAVAESCERSIASPFPWVAFEPHDNDARRWLQDAAGIHELDHVASVPNLSGAPILVEDAEVMGGLSDRWDGVALLAEAFAHKHPTGRLHELFRVFERAFSLPARKLAPALVDFLHPRYGYAADEIGAWIDLRDPATHADARPTFVLEAEVRPVLRRMEQAATDVLINKKLWRDPDLERRDVWRPTAWTRNPRGEGVAHLHTTVRAEAQLLDQFGAYPTDLAGVLSRLPDGWWAPAVTPKTEELGFLALQEGQLDE